MQVPISILGLTHELRNPAAAIQPGVVLSFESQLKLRSLHQYIDDCRIALSEIRADLSLDGFTAEGAVNRPFGFQRASERLGKLCMETDNWGFDALYEVALRLQMLLMNGSGRIRSGEFCEILHRGLTLLSALLDECERDFCFRLAASDLFDSLDEAAR